MPQNVYDDEQFFAAYSELPRSRKGLHGAPEWPTLRTMLPDLARRSVLDLGCGFGWFCRWAAGAGAAPVLGIDLSERMLTRARADTADDRIEYRLADLEAVVLPVGAFDVVYSSLTLHYVLDLDRLLGEVAQAMVPGGRFVCSVEHPIFTAPTKPGFVTTDDGRVVWPVDRYLDEGERVTDWLAPGVIKQHRTIASYFAGLRNAGLELTDLVEWGPDAAQIADVPAWASEAERPPLLLLAAERR